MQANTRTRRAIAILKLPRSVPAFITYAVGIVRAMTGNVYFPAPVPPLAELQFAIDDLQVAQTEAQTRVRGAAAFRNEKRGALVTLVEQLRMTVQTLADANPESAPAIIQSAGLAVRKPLVRAPRVFHASPGPVSGSVKIVAPLAADRASYDWQYSSDGGKTWTRLPTTLRSRTSLSGVVPSTTLLLKYRALTKAGEGDWSQLVSLLVT